MHDSILIESSNPKLHLSHLEDLVIEEGKRGFYFFEEHIINILKYLNGLESKTIVNLKVDGCFSPDTKLVTVNGVCTIKDIIEKLNNGEEIMVLTHNFEQKIDEYCQASKPMMKTGEKNWIELELENGDLVCCTEDHLIYTNNRGYVPAKDLTQQDDIKEYKG